MLEAENITGEVQSVQTPDAGEKTERISFDELIEGDYRDEYKEKVESIVKQRLKNHAEDKRRLTEITDALNGLAQRMGIEANEPSEIIEELEGKKSAAEAEAGEAFSQKENAAEGTSGFPPHVVEGVKELAARVEQTKELYPGFDILSELRDPVFVKLMAAAEGDPRRAYEMKYHDRIVTEAMQYAAATAEERLAVSMASRVSRPAENAVSGGSTVMITQDPKNLTRAQRSEIKKRVRRGEKILW